MARRKKGTPVHGWLILDKPGDMTSTRALAITKRLFDARKAGHAGTLDPLATGILPIAFGEATKTVPFVVDGMKSYQFTVRWGVETATDDSEGEVTAHSDVRPARDAIEAVLPSFIGEISQVPPRFSAIKIDGNRAYDLAREGEQIEMKARQVRVQDLRLVATPDTDHAVLEADCGKGTYVRSLARDIGRALATFGHVTALRRTRVGPFGLDDAVRLDELEAASEHDPGTLSTYVLPVEKSLEALQRFSIEPADAARLASGQPVLVRGRDAPKASGPVYATSKGRLIALAEIDKGALRPTRVFNFSS